MAHKRRTVGGYGLIFGYLGVFMVLIGIICLLPLFLLIPYSSEASTAKNFLIPGLSSIVVGLALALLLLFRREKLNLGKHQDSVLLVLIWLSAILICSVPFIMGGMSFTDAVFESTSGYSTTGLTRFYTYSDALSGLHIYKFYRSTLLFFGGVGLVLIVSCALSDRFGLRLYTAEGHNDKLLPNLGKSARSILSIYLIYITLGSIAYTIAGMDAFDAVCHSISALATGGFSSRQGGIPEAGASGNMLAIEIISCVLMVCGATNFLTHMFLLRGKFKKVFQDCEVRFFGVLAVILVPLFFAALLLSNENGYTPIESLRYGTFTFFSAITTTGFSNVESVLTLGETAMFLIIMCTIVGGGMGSTSGAVKQYRFVIAFKTLYWSIRDHLAPSRMVYPRYVRRFGEKKEVKPEESYEAYRFLLVYLLAIAVGSILIMLIGSQDGVTMRDGFFEFTNAISSTGLSCGLTEVANVGIRWVLIVGMFLGRLEIFAVYFAIFRITRDILRKETI